MIRRWAIGLAVLLSLGVSVQVARAADQDFTLVNKTGVEIHRVFVSPHDQNRWGPDILKRDTFPDGVSMDVVFHPEEEAEDWDIKIEDKEGTSVVWTKLRLTKITKITLHLDGKEATAVIE